jgi:putative transposase
MILYEAYYHLDWTTQNLASILDSTWETELYRVVVAEAQKMESETYALGIMPDHIHLLTSISPNYSVETFLNRIRAICAEYINHVIQPDTVITWDHDDYGAMTFERRHLPKMIEYVRNQKDHHTNGPLYRDLEPRSSIGKKRTGDIYPPSQDPIL